MSIILENRLCRNVGLLYLKLILLPTVTEYIPPVLDKTFAIRAENMFWWTLLTRETALTFWVMWSKSLVYVCKKMCLRLAEIHMDPLHYTDVIMGVMASQITSLSIVCSTVCSGRGQRKHKSSASLTFVRGIHWWPVNSPHKGPVTRKMLTFDNVVMIYLIATCLCYPCSTLILNWYNPERAHYALD